MVDDLLERCSAESWQLPRLHLELGRPDEHTITHVFYDLAPGVLGVCLCDGQVQDAFVDFD